MPELLLRGCRTEPLGSYLKALGVFRLVSEQLDDEVAGRWVGETFSIETSVDSDGLLDFFLHDYRPTPVIAPWNGRTITAFHDDKSRNPIRDLEQSNHDRLEAVRRTIGATRDVYDEGRRLGLNPKDKKAKDHWVRLSRNSFPDEALAWLDAVVVLTSDKSAFPLITGGTGGVLGSGDLSLNFLEKLQQLVSMDSQVSSELLRASILGIGRPRLRSGLVGQFDPGGTGGAAVGATLVNPWNLVLLIEGALLFTSGAARRMGFGNRSHAATPFTVRGTLAGFGSAASAEQTKGEVWAPVWRAPAGVTEIRALLGEGRASWAGQQSRTALDFARAAGSLGVDRGIDHFVRYSIGVRHGQGNLAVPVGRVAVRERNGIPVLGQLDRWLRSVRSIAEPPAAIATGLRLVERAMFDTATTGRTSDFQRLLTAVSDLDRVVSRSGQTRAKVSPVNSLASKDWLSLLDDGSSEFVLASGLASGRPTRRGPSSLRLSTQPVRIGKAGHLEWTEAPPAVDGVGVRPLFEVVSQYVAKRGMDASHQSDEPGSGGTGVTIGSRFAQRVPIGVARAFFANAIDATKLARLTGAFTSLNWSDDTPSAVALSGLPLFPHSPAFSILAPFGHYEGVDHPRLGTIHLKADPRWPMMLRAGHSEEVLAQALRRLANARLEPPPASPRAMAVGVDPHQLAAALVLPLFPKAVLSLIDKISTFDDQQAINERSAP